MSGIIYNVTIKVEKEIAALWINWLIEEHIPEVMQTNCFISYQLVHLLETDEDEGFTYAIQYRAESRSDYNRFIEIHSAEMRQKSIDKWGNQFFSFRTIMEIIR